MGGLIGMVASWFFGGGLTKLGQIGLDYYRAKLTSENSTEVQVVELAKQSTALAAREAELNSRLLVAEQGNWFTRWVRPAWAFPFVFWTYKVVIWDICLGLGTTPDLKGTPGYLCLLVAGSYFGERAGSKMIDKIMQWRMVISGKKS